LNVQNLFQQHVQWRYLLEILMADVLHLWKGDWEIPDQHIDDCWKDLRSARRRLPDSC